MRSKLTPPTMKVRKRAGERRLSRPPTQRSKVCYTVYMPYKDPEKQRAYQRAYHTEYHQKRFAAREAEMIAYLGDKCAKCGSANDLEFDHIDRTTKSFSIKAKWTLPWDKIVIELDKCQLLCCDCHQEKIRSETYAFSELKHGDWRRYKYHKCRCLECKIAYRERRKQWGAN